MQNQTYETLLNEAIIARDRASDAGKKEMKLRGIPRYDEDVQHPAGHAYKSPAHFAEAKAKLQQQRLRYNEARDRWECLALTAARKAYDLARLVGLGADEFARFPYPSHPSKSYVFIKNKGTLNSIFRIETGPDDEMIEEAYIEKRQHELPL